MSSWVNSPAKEQPHFLGMPLRRKLLSSVNGSVTQTLLCILEASRAAGVPGRLRSRGLWVGNWASGILTSSASTGRKMMMVAVLLANSVKKAMTTVMSIAASRGGTCSRGCNCPPIHADSPDSCGQMYIWLQSTQYHTSQAATRARSTGPGDLMIYLIRMLSLCFHLGPAPKVPS